MYARLRCGGNLPLCVWHSVPERATYGTEYACRAQKGFLGYATHFQRNSVLKIGFYGTEEIFGAKNSLLWYATHFQSAVPKAALAAPDASSVRETATARGTLERANLLIFSGWLFLCLSFWRHFGDLGPFLPTLAGVAHQ